MYVRVCCRLDSVVLPPCTRSTLAVLQRHPIARPLQWKRRTLRMWRRLIRSCDNRRAHRRAVLCSEQGGGVRSATYSFITKYCLYIRYSRIYSTTMMNYPKHSISPRGSPSFAILLYCMFCISVVRDSSTLLEAHSLLLAIHMPEQINSNDVV